MFFENEVTRTLTMIEFLLLVIMGLAPVALTIWMKLVLYRRRVAEGERDLLPRADRQSREAGRAGVFSGDTVPPFFQVRELRMVRDIRPEQTVWALCSESGGDRLKFENQKKGRNHLLSTLNGASSDKVKAV